VTLKLGLGVTQGHRNQQCIDPPSITSCLRSIVTVGLSRTVSQINGDFSRKLQIPHPRVFYAPDEGIALELGVDARSK